MTAMLPGELSKGMSGKVATIGGCREYTGAPYFASMTCLRVSSIHCTPSDRNSNPGASQSDFHEVLLMYMWLMCKGVA